MTSILKTIKYCEKIKGVIMREIYYVHGLQNNIKMEILPEWIKYLI